MEHNTYSESVPGKYYKQYNSSFMNNSKYIGDICKPLPAFDISNHCIVIKDFLEKHEAEGLCLLKNDHVAGLIMKTHLDATLSSQYGYSLFAKKPVYKIMDSSCLVVDYYTPVSKVSEKALARPEANIYDNIIVTKHNKYHGMVSLINLLKHSLETERNFALELNPLTGLPGNRQINRALEQSISSNRNCCIMYIDLDNFKVYNDIYGFENGDRMIHMTKDVICAIIEPKFVISSFIGHIGGDDFIVIIPCYKNEAVEICKRIIETFDSQVLSFFTEKDKGNGYVYGLDRNKVYSRFPLTSISIAISFGSMGYFNSPYELSKHMSHIKEKAKEVPGSSYYIDCLPSQPIKSEKELA